ncbi:DUF1501 domain-containing protein [Lignipirellula cremea]|uniref:DUF1501 domain-containing protein n=1 Tax=Lignipirellula cremea TaxID=2528010 RepID=A0A518E2V4_9BACT|nr:DUF1501 domain-containing protein [Lignipirellula cremea]QDU98392.1 hypothetical protein Pla8534_62600 [Lignipirellula cremea]
MNTLPDSSCGGREHLSRRTFLQAGGLAGGLSLTPVAEALSRAAEKQPSGAPARSVIVLWLQGGPSQLDTFDPKPGSPIGGEVKDRSTAVKGIQLAAGFEQLADQMQHVSLIRSLISKEGDHERATYNMKTGYRPDPTLIHPSIGAVVCHQLTDQLEIPRHVSILPNTWAARGGYLGDQYDAFKIGDPRGPVPDVRPQVSDKRFAQRIQNLDLLEKSFARGRLRNLDEQKTLHQLSTQRAVTMMSSDQLVAFDIQQEPLTEQQAFGDSAMGRSCLAAARLIEAGVRCVEVTFGNWDSHINNAQFQAEKVAVLDPAFAALIRRLKERRLLDSTLVLCGGEFGRTPQINPAGGRDHWPHGFSMALAGGGVAGGRVIGETSPDPETERDQRGSDVVQPHPVADVHATVFHCLGINFEQELQTPIGRPMAIAQGKVIEGLL